MNLHLPVHMTVDEFLRWSQQQESGRYELEGGRVVVQQSQNIAHLKTKARALDALESAIARTGAPHYALPDGAMVRIARDRAYEPDMLVAPLPMPPDESLEVPNPIIVVEVMSPSPASMRRDLTTKAVGYALVPSIEHYLVIDPAERVVHHYRRKGDMLVPPEAPAEGTLRLDPPGIEVDVEDLLVPRET